MGTWTTRPPTGIATDCLHLYHYYLLSSNRVCSGHTAAPATQQHSSGSDFNLKLNLNLKLKSVRFPVELLPLAVTVARASPNCKPEWNGM